MTPPQKALLREVNPSASSPRDDADADPLEAWRRRRQARQDPPAGPETPPAFHLMPGASQDGELAPGNGAAAWRAGVHMAGATGAAGAAGAQPSSGAAEVPLDPLEAWRRERRQQVADPGYGGAAGDTVGLAYIEAVGGRAAAAAAGGGSHGAHLPQDDGGQADEFDAEAIMQSLAARFGLAPRTATAAAELPAVGPSEAGTTSGGSADGQAGTASGSGAVPEVPEAGSVLPLPLPGRPAAGKEGEGADATAETWGAQADVTDGLGATGPAGGQQQEQQPAGMGVGATPPQGAGTWVTQPDGLEELRGHGGEDDAIGPHAAAAGAAAAAAARPMTAAVPPAPPPPALLPPNGSETSPPPAATAAPPSPTAMPPRPPLTIQLPASTTSSSSASPVPAQPRASWAWQPAGEGAPPLPPPLFMMPVLNSLLDQSVGGLLFGDTPVGSSAAGSGASSPRLAGDPCEAAVPAAAAVTVVVAAQGGADGGGGDAVFEAWEEPGGGMAADVAADEGMDVAACSGHGPAADQMGGEVRGEPEEGQRAAGEGRVEGGWGGSTPPPAASPGSSPSTTSGRSGQHR